MLAAAGVEVRHRFGDYDAAPLRTGLAHAPFSSARRMTFRFVPTPLDAPLDASASAGRRASIPPWSPRSCLSGPGGGAGAAPRARRSGGHHRPAARPLHRTALHHAQGALDRRAGPGAGAPMGAPGGAGLLGRRRRPRFRRGEPGVVARRPTGTLATAALPPRPPDAPSRPCTASRSGEGVERALESLAAEPARRPSSARTRSPGCAGTIGPRLRWPGAFAGAMAELLAPLGIVCFDSTHPAVKRAAAPLMLPRPGARPPRSTTGLERRRSRWARPPGPRGGPRRRRGAGDAGGVAGPRPSGRR